ATPASSWASSPPAASSPSPASPSNGLRGAGPSSTGSSQSWTSSPKSCRRAPEPASAALRPSWAVGPANPALRLSDGDEAPVPPGPTARDPEDLGHPRSSDHPREDLPRTVVHLVAVEDHDVSEIPHRLAGHGLHPAPGITGRRRAIPREGGPTAGGHDG